MIKDIFESYKQLNGNIFQQKLFEGSMSRFLSAFTKHKACIITAYRNEFTKAENRKRNRDLYAILKSFGYGITAVKGGYAEAQEGSLDKKEITEASFVVVNLNDDAKFLQKMFKLGVYFNQDSIMFIESPKSAKLIGTSRRAGAYPAFARSEKFDKIQWKPYQYEFFTRLGGSVFQMVQTKKIKNENLNLEYEMQGLSEGLQKKLGNELKGVVEAIPDENISLD